jgi:hypothetical protein
VSSSFWVLMLEKESVGIIVTITKPLLQKVPSTLTPSTPRSPCFPARSSRSAARRSAESQFQGRGASTEFYMEPASLKEIDLGDSPSPSKSSAAPAGSRGLPRKWTSSA